MPTYENDEFIAFDIDDILADPETIEPIAKLNTVMPKSNKNKLIPKPNRGKQPSKPKTNKSDEHGFLLNMDEILVDLEISKLTAKAVYVLSLTLFYVLRELINNAKK